MSPEWSKIYFIKAWDCCFQKVRWVYSQVCRQGYSLCCGINSEGVQNPKIFRSWILWKVVTTSATIESDAELLVLRWPHEVFNDQWEHKSFDLISN